MGAVVKLRKGRGKILSSQVFFTCISEPVCAWPRIKFFKIFVVKFKGIKSSFQRLNRLVKFSEEWLQTNIGNAENSSATKQFRENYVKRKVKQIKKVAQRFEKVYSAKNPKTGELRCGYYDPTTTYGGPQEVPPVSLSSICTRFFGTATFMTSLTLVTS